MVDNRNRKHKTMPATNLSPITPHAKDKLWGSTYHPIGVRLGFRIASNAVLNSFLAIRSSPSDGNKPGSFFSQGIHQANSAHIIFISRWIKSITENSFLAAYNWETRSAFFLFHLMNMCTKCLKACTNLQNKEPYLLVPLNYYRILSQPQISEIHSYHPNPLR